MNFKEEKLCPKLCHIFNKLKFEVEKKKIIISSNVYYTKPLSILLDSLQQENIDKKCIIIIISDSDHETEPYITSNGYIKIETRSNNFEYTAFNMVKKHTKPNPSKGEQGGLINKEMPIQSSNIAIFNNASKKADKVTFKQLKDGKKIRIFKSNQEAIDV